MSTPVVVRETSLAQGPCGPWSGSIVRRPSVAKSDRGRGELQAPGRSRIAYASCRSQVSAPERHALPRGTIWSCLPGRSFRPPAGHRSCRVIVIGAVEGSCRNLDCSSVSSPSAPRFSDVDVPNCIIQCRKRAWEYPRHRACLRHDKPEEVSPCQSFFRRRRWFALAGIATKPIVTTMVTKTLAGSTFVMKACPLPCRA